MHFYQAKLFARYIVVVNIQCVVCIRLNKQKHLGLNDPL